MSKMILEFDLPDERHEAYLASHATNLYSAIIDYITELRQQIKYSDRENLCPIYERFHQILLDHNITLDI